MFNQNINDLLSFSVFFLVNEFVGLEFDCEFQTRDYGFKKGPYKFNPLRLNDLVCSPLEGKIPCLEFTIEIQSNNLMYNPNKEIRNREYPPIKIGKFSVKYYSF